MSRRPICDWAKQPLGLVRDTEIARTLGCTSEAVCHQRIRRGIPSAFGKGRPRLSERRVAAPAPIVAMVRAAFRGTWIGGAR